MGSINVGRLKDSKVFCILPWTHLDIFPAGNVSACCYSAQTPLGTLADSSLKEIWNGDEIKRLRINMLEERPSPRCSRCYAEEQAEFTSFRQAANLKFAEHLPKTLKTGTDGSVETMGLPFLELRLSNVCNFRCRICGPWASSAWYPEAKKIYGGDYAANRRSSASTPDPNELLRQLEPLLPSVEQINFAGGEPLIMDEHYRFLDALIERRLFHIRLSYNTNLSTLTHKGTDVLKQWRHFGSVRVVASLDGSGRRGEYMRTGQKWDDVIRNMERLRVESPEVEFAVQCTLSAMNAMHVPDFHWEWTEEGRITPAQFSINLLDEPREYNVRVMPLDLKTEVTDKYAAHAERLKTACSSAEAKRAGRPFKSAVKYMLAKDYSSDLPKFREKTRQLDAMRGQDFAATFPESAALMAEPAA